MIFSNENRTWPSLCGWIWQLDCVSLGHWPQGTTPGILSCWHRFSNTAMPTVLWSFKTGCTSEQCKVKSRECERVSLSVCAVFLQLDCAVLCLCLFPSSHLSHDGAGVRVPANKSSRQFSTHSLFSPPLSFLIIPEYISEGNVFSTRTTCEVKYIFFSTNWH